jgi:hypothetical protein
VGKLIMKEVRRTADKKEGFKKLETDYLGASDIVSHVGGQYVIKEREMETALHETLEEIEKTQQGGKIEGPDEKFMT